MADTALPPPADLVQVREYLSYDPVTGRFDWTKRPRGAARWTPGTPAGCVRPDGYRVINWKGRQYLAHHLAWWFVHGSWPSRLDHRDRVPSNNSIANLRLCSKAQNGANARPRRTQYRGVHRHKKGGFVATIAKKYIGYFQTASEAALAYDDAARKKYGEFAHTNFQTRK